MVFSEPEHELTFTFAICRRPSVCRVMLNYAGEYCEYGEYCDAGDA